MLHIESVMQSSSGLAFFKFHLGVGIRVALRVLVAAVALFFALFYLLKPELFIGITARLISDGFPGGMAAVLSCLVFAGIASRRVSLGLAGWIRHLPASTLPIPPGVLHDTKDRTRVSCRKTSAGALPHSRDTGCGQTRTSDCRSQGTSLQHP